MLHLHATIYNVQIIGEAVYKLSKEFKQQHPQTPWAVIEKMRHILVHDYFRINFEVLWDVVTKDIPLLKSQVLLYLSDVRGRESTGHSLLFISVTAKLFWQGDGN